MINFVVKIFVLFIILIPVLRIGGVTAYFTVEINGMVEI